MRLPWFGRKGFEEDAAAAEAKEKDAEAAEDRVQAAALARSREVFRIAVAANRARQERGEPQRVSGAFLSECDDVATASIRRKGARAFGAAARNPPLTVGETDPGLATAVLDFVQFGPEAVDGLTAESLVAAILGERHVELAKVAPPVEPGDCLRYPCTTFWDGCCACLCCACGCCVGVSEGAVSTFACYSIIVVMALGLLFGLSFAASLPWAPTHTEEWCTLRRPACAPRNVTVQDLSWRSMGIGLGITAACLAAVVGCTLLCCFLYIREGTRMAAARRAIV